MDGLRADGDPRNETPLRVISLGTGMPLAATCGANAEKQIFI